MREVLGNAAGSKAARESPSEPRLRVVSALEPVGHMIPSGIAAFDKRAGGFDAGGVYLISGTPGPAKLVAVLQFLHAGLAMGEKAVLLTGIDAPGVLDVAKAWGSDLHEAWTREDLTVVGFRDDFEMKVLRSTEPEEALSELESLIPDGVSRIAVDPGSMFLQDGARSLLGRSFLDWARNHPATVCATLSIDRGEALPASAEWLVHATTAVLLVDRLPGGLYQLSTHRSLPGSSGEPDDAVTLQLTPGVGLTSPDYAPGRRSSDRPMGDPDQVLMVSLGGRSAADVEAWAKSMFTTEVVTEPLEGVTRLQEGTPVGSILIHAPRQRLKEAQQACRALRPMTGAAIVFTSDDSVRSSDRVRLLEAGADDCLTGGVDFRELATRIQQAVSVGGKAPSPPLVMGAGVEALLGGAVSPGLFGNEARRRGEDPTRSVFSLVHFMTKAVSMAELQEALAREIRDEEGDMVTCDGSGCLVLLQGARRDSTHPFLQRFRGSFESRFGQGTLLRVEVMPYPSEKDGVRQTLESLIASDSGDLSSANTGGPGERKA